MNEIKNLNIKTEDIIYLLPGDDILIDDTRCKVIEITPYCIYYIYSKDNGIFNIHKHNGIPYSYTWGGFKIIPNIKFRYSISRQKYLKLGAVKYKSYRNNLHVTTIDNLKVKRTETEFSKVIFNSKGDYCYAYVLKDINKTNYRYNQELNAFHDPNIFKVSKNICYLTNKIITDKDLDVELLLIYEKDKIENKLMKGSLIQISNMKRTLKLEPNTAKEIINNLKDSDILNYLKSNNVNILINQLDKFLKTNTFVEFLKSGTIGYAKFRNKDNFANYQEFRNLYVNERKTSSKIATEGLNYTFGIEIEMQKCFIPEYLRPHLNISCVRDGSINNVQGDRRGGPEFVTGVLQNDAGFIHLNKICNEITKRGILDKSCGKMFATL
jgi:hypothetical protein